MYDLYANINDKFFFQRFSHSDQFIGNARLLDFDGPKAITLNPDAYYILDLLDRNFSIGECIDILAQDCGMDKKDLLPVVEDIIQSFLHIGLVTVGKTKAPAARPALPTCMHMKEGDPLEEVFFEVISTCNLKCKHCYGSFGPSRCEALSKETVFSVLDQLKELQCPDVKFTGGEVFLHKDFLDILSYAHRRNFILTVLTNATLITPSIVEKLRKIGQIQFHISIDGHNAAIHDEFRGGIVGAFDKSIRAVKSLKDAGFKIKITHTVHKQNYRFAEQMWDLAEELGVSISASHVYKFGNCLENSDDIYIGPSDYCNFYKNIKPRFSGADDKNTAYITTDLPGNGSGQSKLSYIERCEAGRTKLAIRPNGDVTPCITFPHIDKFVIGNIHDTAVKEIHNQFDRKKMLGNVNALDIESCKNCNIVTECKGGCLAVSYAETGRYDRVDPFTCAREHVLRT